MRMPQLYWESNRSSRKPIEPEYTISQWCE